MKKIFLFFLVFIITFPFSATAKTFKEMQEEDAKFLSEYEHGENIKKELSQKKESEYLNLKKTQEEKSKYPLLYYSEAELSNMSIDAMTDYMKKLKAFCDEPKNKSFSSKCAEQALTIKSICEKRLEKIQEDKKNKEPVKKSFGLNNGKLYQCDGVDMFVDEGQRGESGKRMLDINFHFTSSEIGGTLYWQNDTLSCNCEVFSNGRSIESQSFTLNSYEQHIFFELDSSEMKKLGKHTQISCTLQPASSKIVITKDLYF